MKDFRTKFHIEPPRGWLNDPNGLCQFNGEYYMYFQYSPENVLGGNKVWGLYKGKNLFDLKFQGEKILCDTPYDKDGAYSGSAYVENGEIHIFYTGNVKENIQNADYINSGRISNTIYTSTKDGESYTQKELLLTNEDYPKNYTQHIRDPKIFKEDDIYYMVLGGRTKENIGSILLYSSKDLKKWNYLKDLTSSERLGYMWECPDIFSLGDKVILSISPQGVARGEFSFQNVYASGYYISDKSFVENTPNLTNFFEWDYGFDFYAPQTFLDENGRRILIAWAGLPDIEYEYTNKSVEFGWQHLMTIPRVLKLEDNKIIQQIPEEFFENLGSKITDTDEASDCFYADIKTKNFTGIIAEICQDLELSYSDNVFKMKFNGDIGGGRGERKCIIEDLKNIQIIMDKSIIEVFLNGGEKVFTSRIYPKSYSKTEIYTEKYELFNL